MSPAAAGCQVPFPAASEVSTLPAIAPVERRKPVTAAVPATSRAVLGIVVPMPTRPRATRAAPPTPVFVKCPPKPVGEEVQPFTPAPDPVGAPATPVTPVPSGELV